MGGRAVGLAGGRDQIWRSGLGADYFLGDSRVRGCEGACRVEAPPEELVAQPALSSGACDEPQAPVGRLEAVNRHRSRTRPSPILNSASAHPP